MPIVIIRGGTELAALEHGIVAPARLTDSPAPQGLREQGERNPGDKSMIVTRLKETVARMMRPIAALALMVMVAGCAARSPIPRHNAAAAGPIPAAATSAALSPTYKLDTGDRLQIRFPYHGELDSITTVRSDGRLTVAGLGEFQAYGLTTDELEQDIYRRASLTHRNPETYVLVAEARAVKAYVGGEVQRPGFVAVRPGLTSLRAVLERGGFLSSAKLSSVLHIRWDAQGEYTAKLIDLKRVLETGDTTQDLVVAANDVVYVPATAISNANLWVRQYITDLLPIKPPSTRLPDIGN